MISHPPKKRGRKGVKPQREEGGGTARSQGGGKKGGRNSNFPSKKEKRKGKSGVKEATAPRKRGPHWLLLEK